jgi:hypothetical protein
MPDKPQDQDQDQPSVADQIAAAVQSALAPVLARLDGQSKKIAAFEKLAKSGAAAGDPPAAGAGGKLDADIAARLKSLEDARAENDRERTALNSEFVRSKIRGLAVEKYKLDAARAQDFADLLSARHPDLIRDGNDVVFATTDARVALGEWLDLFLHNSGRHWLPQKNSPPRTPAPAGGTAGRRSVAPSNEELAAGRYDENVKTSDVIGAAEEG